MVELKQIISVITLNAKKLTTPNTRQILSDWIKVKKQDPTRDL